MQENKLTLNINKTKEMIVGFGKQQREHPPIHIDGTVVEKVECFKFLGVHITDKLKWSTHTGAAAPLQPHEAEEIWLVTKYTQPFADAQSRASCRAVSQPGTATAQPTTVRFSRG